MTSAMDETGFEKKQTRIFSQLDIEMDLDEVLLFPSCVKKIIANIDKNLLDPKMNRSQISRLLTCRWLLTSGIR
jgi:hypothetical protein